MNGTTLEKNANAAAADSDIVERILCHQAKLYSSPDEFETVVINDPESGHYLILDQG